MVAGKFHGIAGAAAMLLCGAAAAPNAAAETKSFAVSYFYDANYSDGKTDCPDGTNLSAIDFYRRDLARLGHSHEEIEKALKDFPGEGGLTQPWVPLVITRGNGKDNVYANPTTEPDPGLKMVQSKYAYGFNLDGKGAASPNAFEENPETHEKGINNQLYRVMGCIRSYRGLPPPGRPSLAENLWDVLRDVMPAWLVTVSSPDSLSKDGPVTVTIDRALDRVTRDASGGAAQADMTYQIDPDQRSHSVLKGKIEHGVVTTDPGEVHIVVDPYLMPELNLTQAKLRIELKPDGSGWATLGGYQPWQVVYYSMANQGHIKEYAASIDVPAVYYALKRSADGDPDPKTGEFRRISSAYRLELVSAFAVPPNDTRNKTAAVAPQGQTTETR